MKRVEGTSLQSGLEAQHSSRSLLLLLACVSMKTMLRSSPETLGRCPPACHFLVASALWPKHKSGRNNSPRFAQEDRGANKGV